MTKKNLLRLWIFEATRRASGFTHPQRTRCHRIKAIMSSRTLKLLLCLMTFSWYVNVVTSLLSAASLCSSTPFYRGDFCRIARSSIGLSENCDGCLDEYDNYDSDNSQSKWSEWTSLSSTTDDSSDNYEVENTKGIPKREENMADEGSCIQSILDGITNAYPTLDNMSDEDYWIESVLDEIYNAYPSLDDPPLYDTSFDEPDIDRTVEDSTRNNMDDEIAMLVRCNEQPDLLLIEEGRALPPLSIEEKNDVSQLVFWNGDAFEATDFLKQSVSSMFKEHAKPDVRDGVLSMDRECIASWMTKSLQKEEKGKVSQHDIRVTRTMSDFSEYGSGRIVEENFQNLYLRCISGNLSNPTSISANRHLQLRTSFRDAVWRDIRAHGMLSPIEEERLIRLKEVSVQDSMSTMGDNRKEAEQAFVDECEILDWDFRASEQNNQNYRHESSHKLVELTDDKRTPLWIRDGDFVFIDEESCIGCRQCVNIAPSSFLMMESNRARTFAQRVGTDVEQAVDACPVSCMHRVSFDELKNCETARDTDASSHFEKRVGHIPVHVAGIDSDRNRRTSLYHTMKARCAMSSSCPQKGCFDCPSFRNKGENPYFIAKHKEAVHTRAQHFIKNGDANIFRKAVDL